MRIPQMRWWVLCGVMCFAAAGNTAVDWKGKQAEEAFGLTTAQVATDYTVQEIASASPANIFWPGDTVRFTLQFTNPGTQALVAQGKAEVIHYGMTSDPQDWWKQIYVKFADCGSVPISVSIPAKGYTNIEVTPVQPKVFGAYVLVVDLPGHGRQFAAAYVYVPEATPGRVFNPTYAMDIRFPSPAMCDLFQRLGIKGCRWEVGFEPTDTKQYKYKVVDMAEKMQRMQQHDITLMACMESSSNRDVNPLGVVRSHLNEQNEGRMGFPGDAAWLPKYDEDYREFIYFFASTWGWPKGPVNAVELWNEPWEGGSISGWAADMIRYREIYTKMAEGVEDARKNAGVQVLIGGTCSSMNTEDKLFGDGKDTFLKWLDFTSIHYQPMGNVPALIPAWVNRKSPNGPVQAWDTESWMANSEDRVAAVIASMRAQGQGRTAGVFHGAVLTQAWVNVRTDSGTKSQEIMQTWSTAAGIAALQTFIGQRSFKELLFRNGLPWVFLFNGIDSPDDGTVVVVGDLGGVYERGLYRFNTVYGLANAPKIAAFEQQLAALPATDTPDERKALERQLATARILTGASMTFDDQKGAFQLFDFYGNRIPAVKGKLVVPLNGLGYFLRTNGKLGSFTKLTEALRAARIEGLEPVEIQACDLTAPVAQQPALTVTLTNILNRAVSGTLGVTMGGLTLDVPTRPLTLAAQETKTLTLKVTGGTANEANAYPLTASFDAGKDGKKTHTETMHVNLIAHRTITVDGKLDDWQGVLPQMAQISGDKGPSLTEKAWLPFVTFPEKTGSGLSVAYMAYDAQYFYFAAKVSDSSPSPGTVRFATRDDDQYFYPVTSYKVEKLKDGTVKRTELTWPEGVRRFTYRKIPDLPYYGDAIQLALNVLPAEKKALLAAPPGTMDKFMVYQDTDYEYFLHQVGEPWGGGTEIFRLLAPGVPRKHFYPRQPKAEKDGGPVTGGKLVITQDGATRLVECAFPWSELPDVKAAIDAGRPLKITYRVTDDKGPSYDLTTGRSVAKQNDLTFHPYWETFGANEVAFGVEK